MPVVQNTGSFELKSDWRVWFFGLLSDKVWCGNEAFFKYFIYEVILPFVHDIQAIIQSSTEMVSYILIIVLNKLFVSLIIY